jgi:toxin ParE1/3/4
VFTRGARRQIERIVDGIAAHSPRGAASVRARIRAVTGLLADHPRAGRRTDMDGIRRVPVVPYPYLIFYRVTADAVVVQFVRHAARDPSGLLDL